jgi:hypothetical protein
METTTFRAWNRMFLITERYNTGSGRYSALCLPGGYGLLLIIGKYRVAQECVQAQEVRLMNHGRVMNGEYGPCVNG